MNIRQLEYLCEIVKTGSFSKSAENLYVAQPAISFAIKQLEEEIGLLLFHREKKRVALTSEGMHIFKHAKKILSSMEDMKNDIDDLRNIKTGSVQLGMPEMLGTYYYSDLITSFINENPGIKMVLDSGPSNAIKAKVLDKELDIGVIALETITDNLEGFKLMSEEIVIGVSKDNPLSRRKSLSISDISGEKLILFGKGNFHQREHLLNLMNAEGIDPNIVFESNIAGTVKSLTAKDVGISAFLKNVITDDKDIISVSIEPKLMVDIGVVWRRNSYISKANRHFIEYIKKGAN